MVDIALLKKANSDLYKQLRELILKSLDESLYQNDRYGQEFSSLLIHAAENALNAEDCKKHLRKSDHAYQLDENLVLIYFDHANFSGGVSAAQKLQYAIHNMNIHLNLYYAEAHVYEKEEHSIDIASQLLSTLIYAVEESVSNQIVDYSMLRL